MTVHLYSPGSFHFSLACNESISFLVREGTGNFPEPFFPVWQEEDFKAAEKSIKEIMEDSPQVASLDYALMRNRGNEYDWKLEGK
ncbi:MAG: hypothetical protein IJ987_07845, partial [Firmicutes bacterium]|nr:hypothetical protein [Bacillota bacterium]